jgi:uncharacterized protein YlxW (UPF0749 family)
MKRQASVFSLVLVYFVLGILIVMQLRSTSRAASSSLSTTEQAQVLSTLLDSNDGLRNEIAELETQSERLKQANLEENSAALQAELSRMLVLTGRASVSGPGVTVDVSGQINPLDMQDLINELRNAGVEAIALDGYRIVVRSVVSREGTDLAIDGNRLVPPYRLQAIGQPDTIEKALLRRGGLVSLLEFAYPGLKITVLKAESLVLPAYKASIDFKYAQPAP